MCQALTPQKKRFFFCLVDVRLRVGVGGRGRGDWAKAQ